MAVTMDAPAPRLPQRERVCAAPGCERRAHSRGLCPRCYRHQLAAERKREQAPASPLVDADRDRDVSTLYLSDDRVPVRLVRELRRDRDRFGLPFAEVFTEDCELVTRDLPEHERDSWRTALNEQREAWRQAYEREPGPLADFTGGVGMLTAAVERDPSLQAAAVIG